MAQCDYDSAGDEPDRTEEIAQKLKEVISVDLQLAEASRVEDTSASLEHDLGMDSVAVIELIAAVEEFFGFEFLDCDLRPETFESMDSLAAVIAARTRVGPV